ncbi:hypothetical protein ACFO3D_07865 [Virgibacillus kekensis]|uniref:DUF4181 domain-containing protein n=1 Tax=Virgibacillus kekensis TaxID=202261 RepID=A0ABV9DH69_9BACI
MRHPYEKFIRLEIITLILAGVIGFIAVFQGFPIIMIFCLYLLAISIFSEALIYTNTFQTAQGMKQFAKAFLLILFATILLFQL